MRKCIKCELFVAIVVQAVCVNAQYVNMKKQETNKNSSSQKGPTPQGLKINYKKIQIVKITIGYS